MLNECIPTFEAGYTQKITVHAGYAMTGKTFAGPLSSYQTQGPGLANDPLTTGDGGNLICPAAPTANGQVSGVIGWDVPSGGKAPIIRGEGTILPVTSGAAVAVQNELMVDGQGRVIPYVTAAGNRRVGIAHSAVGGAALDVYVELYAIQGPGV